MIGKRLSHYEILRVIGEGGMGVVYVARDEHLHCDVALKVLRPGFLADDAARRRFRGEALAIAKRRHPNLVAVIDFDTQDGLDFIVMEYVEGPTLSDLIQRGSLPEDDIADLGAQIAKGIIALHGARVIHRDLKPGNLKITPDGVLKILDFGLAKFRHDDDATGSVTSVTQIGHAVGTVPYMAPELLLGKQADERTDVYAVGVVLYQMATGRLPHAETTRSTLVEAILTEIPAPPSAWNANLTPAFESVILKAMNKDATRRHQSSAELLADLERAAKGGAGPMSVPPPSPPSPVPRAGRPRMAAIAGAAVLAIAAAWVIHDRLWPPPRPPVSLAVLPLRNLSSDKDQEFFAEGMTEELTTTLAQIKGLRVISRTSVLASAPGNRPLPDVARKLGVGKILEGSILRSGSRVRITVQLVDAAEDRHLWAETYDRELSDALTLQADVARSISHAVQVTLTPQEEKRFDRTRPVVPAAHEAYLKGLQRWNRRDPGEAFQAIELFRQAIALDSTFARPHAALADAYNFLGNYSAISQAAARGAAKTEALRALELDPDLGEAYVSLALVKMEFEWDWDGAERDYRRAIELNPGYAAAHQYYAEYLARMGRHQEALASVNRALELDPLSPSINGMKGTVYYYGREPEEAIEQYRRTLSLQENQVLARFCLGLTLLQLKRYPEAITEFKRSVEDSHGAPLMRAGLGCAYGLAGRRADAKRVLEELRTLSGTTAVAPSCLSLVCLGLGDKEGTLRYMEDALKARDSYIGHLKVLPLVDPVRSDPRFVEILRRAGLSSGG